MTLTQNKHLSHNKYSSQIALSVFSKQQYFQTVLGNTKLSTDKSDRAHTLLQAKWSAVFLELSCKVRSALALLTSTSGEIKTCIN